MQQSTTMGVEGEGWTEWGWRPLLAVEDSEGPGMAGEEEQGSPYPVA